MLLNDVNIRVNISSQVNRSLVNVVEDVMHRVVSECAACYNFDVEEAYRRLGLNNLRLEEKVSSKAVVKPKRAVKSLISLPYNGEVNLDLCNGLRVNNGLYTQCQSVKCGDHSFCKTCQTLAEKSENGIPEYGTIQERQSVGIFEYVDPKGRRPIAYTKWMKKNKVTKEQVLEEAGKQNITINEDHFVEAESMSKRGRPKAAGKELKEPKEKGVKGRPKKTKKVLEIESDDTNDLFASLVANANNSEDEEEEETIKVTTPKSKKDSEEKAQKKKLEEEAKAEKKKLEEEAKAAKEAQRQQEKAEKEAEKEAKAQKKKMAEEAKASSTKEQEKVKKMSKPSEAEVVEEEEEQDVVKKIEFENVKYLKSKKTGIIYDYKKYVNEAEQVVVGHWNDKTNRIDFQTAEESEDEYESDDE
jgi:hypothetical protein